MNYLSHNFCFERNACTAKFYKGCSTSVFLFTVDGKSSLLGLELLFLDNQRSKGTNQVQTRKVVGAEYPK